MITEQMEKRLKEAESMCICGNCATCLELSEEDDYLVYCFPTQDCSLQRLRVLFKEMRGIFHFAR